MVVVTVIFVGFEVSDTVCELVLKVVVVASLVSFSSFADVTAETVTAVVVWLTAEVPTLTDLSAVSAAFPQADKTPHRVSKLISLFSYHHAPCQAIYHISAHKSILFAKVLPLLQDTQQML